MNDAPATTPAAAPGRSPVPTFCLIDDSAVLGKLLDVICSTRTDVAFLGAAFSTADYHARLAPKEPDVVLLDYGIPGDKPLAAIASMHTRGSRHLKPAVVMLSANTEAATVQRALVAGAWGYIGKDAGTEEIIDLVRRSAAGQLVFSRSVRAVLGTALGTLPT